MADVTSSFNEIKIDGNRNKVYIGSKEKFEPMMKEIEKIIRLNIKGIGKRYLPFVKDNFKHVDNKKNNIYFYCFYYDMIFEYLIRQIKIIDDTINIKSCINKDIFVFIDNVIKKIDLKIEIEENTIKRNQAKYESLSKIQPLNDEDWDRLDDYDFFEGVARQKKDKLYLKRKNLQSLKNREEYFFFRKKIFFLVGEALIGKTHLFCDIAVDRITTKKPTLLFFGNQFNSSKTIIENIVSNLGLKPISDDEFLEALDKWGQEYHTRTLIMIDAINETENPKLWQDGIIKFCEQIKSYPNLALAMSIRDVEKNKVITPENEEYITNEIVEVKHKGFEGIELEAVRIFCEALEVEFPKVPIHTYRLFVNPGMLFLYIETIKNSTQKVDTSIINPLTIFKSYVDDLERKYYQRYMNEVDEDDEVVSEAIEEFISLGTQEDYLHFYLDYKDVKKKLKPLHSKILEFLIFEGVLNKLKQEGGTRVYFTYQKFENFFIADYLLNDFEKHREKIGDILFGYDNNALVEAFFMQIPPKLNKEPFELYPNIFDEYELCELYFDSLVWRETRYFTDETFKWIEKIQNDWEGISYKFLEVILQLSAIPNHPLNILSLHHKLLDMSMLQRDYEWSLTIHNLFIEEKIVKRIINWAWDKKEEFEIEDESLYLYGLTLGWFLTSSNRELRDGATKALVNLFTDRVDIFVQVIESFENVNDLYVLERLYTVAYGIVLRSNKHEGVDRLGLYIYQTIFNQDEVVEHILLRDYAKLTVEYIDDIFGLGIDTSRILPPYGSSMPDSYPEYEEVKSYEDKSIAFRSIISSMRTEELMPYGDFGRYTFQSSLTTFNCENIDIQRLSNYAVKVIHDEYIESIDLFDKAESLLNTNSSSRYDHKIERIGKKYQWLTMYKVLSKVADNYQVRDYSYSNFIDYESTERLYIRNIDPTTILKEKIKTDNKCWYYIEDNSFENIGLEDNEAWLKSKEYLPILQDIVNPNIQSEYLILDSFFMKSGNKEREQYRYLMYNIHSYIVKKEEFTEIIEWLKEHDSYDNPIEDVGDNFDEDYLRAYPNSKDDDLKVSSTRHRIHHFEKNIPYEMLQTSVSYSNEGKSYDTSLSDSISIALPTKWLINKMNLKQSLTDGEWLNENNEIVFFDPTVNMCLGASNEGVLVANKELLLNWLNENGYAILWILNGEKDLRNSDISKYDDIPFIGYGGISGYAYFDGNEFIENIDIDIKRPIGW